MIAQDFDQFFDDWKTAKEIFGKVVTEKEAFKVFNALADFALADVKSAIDESLRRSRFAPTVADIVEIIKERYGQDDATLEAVANNWYSELNKGFSMAHDIVTTDKRAVVAFYQCFTDIRDFAEHPLSADVFDRKRFVTTYLRVKPYWADEISEMNNVIKGIYHNNEKPPIRFIGNHQACLEIVKKLYQEKAPKLLSLERPIPVLIENKSPCNEYVKKSDIENAIKELESIIKGGANA